MAAALSRRARPVLGSILLWLLADSKVARLDGAAERRGRGWVGAARRTTLSSSRFAQISDERFRLHAAGICRGDPGGGGWRSFYHQHAISSRRVSMLWASCCRADCTLGQQPRREAFWPLWQPGISLRARSELLRLFRVV